MTPGLSTIFLSEIASGNEEFLRSMMPHLKPEFFRDNADFFERTIFSILTDHYERYNTAASIEEAQIALQKAKLDQTSFQKANAQLFAVYGEPKPRRNLDWLRNNLVEFVRARAYSIAQDKAEEARDQGQNPATHLEEAIASLTFTIDDAPGIGLDPQLIFESIQNSANKIPLTSLPAWPSLARGELAVVVAPPNEGKSTALVHVCSDYLKQGLNVLFVTLEMSDRLTLKRIVGNLLQHNINNLHELAVDQIRSGLDRFEALGKLKIRQFEGGTAHAGHFDQYIAELAGREHFIPDVIIVDYLNECASKKLSHGKHMSMYEYVGACMSELRALAVKHNAIVWTATQTNRNGYDAEPDMKHTSDSARTNQVADVMVGFCADKNMPDVLRTAIIKMRDGGKSKSFVTRAAFSMMTLFDGDDSSLDKKEAKEFGKKLDSISVFSGTRKSTVPRYARPA